MSHPWLLINVRLKKLKGTACICAPVEPVGVLAAFEQKCGGGRGVLCRPGEAQRLSSLTFGCFQVRGKNPQVLTGPAPSRRTLSTQGESEGRGDAGESPQSHISGGSQTLGKSRTQNGTVVENDSLTQTTFFGH